MSGAATAERRAALVEQREHLRKEVVALGGDPDTEDATFDVERGFADSAHSTEERARALSVLRALRSNLGWVERALRKMDLGTYGPCESCGTAISDERLDALPWAVLCIACKAKGEGR